MGTGPLSFADVAAVARGYAAVELSAEAEHEITASRKVIEALAGDDQPHYGVSTGFGRQFHHGVSPRDRNDVGKAQRAGAHDNGVHVFYVTRQARLALGAPTSSCLVSKTV